MLGMIEMERAALETTYDGVMTVIGFRKTVVDGETIVMPDAVLYENEPCALSKEDDAKTAQGEDGGEITPAHKVFCAPELIIPPGCRITVQQYGRTMSLQYSGKAFAYPTHQEIMVQMEAMA